MKRLYKKMLIFFLKFPQKIEVLKVFIAEWIAILRKAPLYKNVKWTVEQQKNFDEFWKKNYGKKISNRWHRLYEVVSGVHHIDYLPEILYTTKIAPKINDYVYCLVYADKNLNELFYNNKIEGVRTPDYFVFNNHGKFYDYNRHLISKEKAIEILSNVGEAVIKPTVDSSSGNNVVLVNMIDGKDVRSGVSAEDIIKKYKSNFTVQEKILANKELSTLYPGSVNTCRVISYIVDDSVEIAPISLRIGGGGSEVDNIHAGGMSIALTNEGCLAKYAYRLGYGDSSECFEVHPDTGIKFEGYKLSFVGRLISTAKRLHEMTANIGTVSWDFTVDSNNNVVVIEANFKGQSVWFPQMLSGESFFGENTEKILKSLRKQGRF